VIRLASAISTSFERSAERFTEFLTLRYYMTNMMTNQRGL